MLGGGCHNNTKLSSKDQTSKWKIGFFTLKICSVMKINMLAMPQDNAATLKSKKKKLFVDN